MKTLSKTTAKQISSKSTVKLIATVLFATVMMTGCASRGGILQSALLGAASGAITQVNGNGDDVRNAATVGALLGILGGVAR